MRKCVLSLLLTAWSISVISQSDAAAPASNHLMHQPLKSNPLYSSGQGNVPTSSFLPNEKAMGTCDEGFGQVGSSYDIFSNYLNYQNQVIYNQDLNAAAFVHNQNHNEPGGAGFISYEYSLDGGDNWVTGHKPITPTLDLIGDGSLIGIGNRYPHGTIYNPPGNTDPANAYFVSVGTAFWSNPNNSILGYEYVASSPLIFDGTEVSEKYHTDPGHTFFRPSGLVSKADGSLWYVNTSWDFLLDPTGTGPTSFKDFYVAKLTFNDATKSFDKEIVDTLEMNYNGVPVSAYRGEYNMGFSPDGQYGYVAFVGGDADQPQVQVSPVIWVSKDGGNTWTKDASLDYNLMTELLKNTLTLSGQVDTSTVVNKRPYMFEYDLTVDNKGNLHLFADMYSGSSFHPDSLNWGYFNGLQNSKLFHFIYLQNSGSWFSWLVKPWGNFPGTVGNTQLRPRPQAGRTPDGKKIFFTWSESEPEGAANFQADVWAYGFDTETSLYAPAKNAYLDSGFPILGVSRLPTLSPVTFAAGGGCGEYDYELPHVIELSLYNEFDPVDHFYAPGVGFDEAEFTEPVSYIPEALFSFSGVGLITNFEDNSTGTPTSWMWDFGDGNNSSEQHPKHTYATGGSYTVCLTVSNGFGLDGPVCQEVQVPFSPVADFTFMVNGLDVGFTDLSVGIPDAWEWNFGDGNTSTEQNPSHTYASNGDYTVCLIASNQGGSSNQVCKTISAGIAPVANFNFTVNGLEVVLQDLSSNSPTAWQWTFGDGNSSSAQNPTHVYSTPGNYEICLVASNNFGNSAVTCIMVLAGDIPGPGFSFSIDGFEVSFTDLSSGVPSSWEWDFGDSNQSVEQNPVHIYSGNGVYNVCLTVSNIIGQSMPVCEEVTVAVLPHAAFSVEITDLTIELTDLTQNQPSSWEWDFGDGNQSTEQNPTHTYAAIGDYTVCLTAGNMAGTDTSCQDVQIIAGSTLEEMGFGKMLVFPNPLTDQVYLSTTKKRFPDEARVEVIDPHGKLVAAAAANVSLDGFSIRAKDWLPGIYFFTVKLEGLVLVSGKLIKH